MLLDKPTQFLLKRAISTSNYINCHLNTFLSNKPTSFHHLLQSHALILTSANASNSFPASKLISLYASFQKPRFSNWVFDFVPKKDTFLWNSIIKAHFSNGGYYKAFEFFVKMRFFDYPPSEFTVPMVVATCAELLWVDEGKCVHGLVTKFGLFERNCAVGSCFVYMYAKCGLMVDACLVFDEISVKDVVSWTALVIGYVQNGESEKGLECVFRMHRCGGDGERVSFRTMEGGFQACGNLGALIQGRCLHCLVVKAGLGCLPSVQSSMLSMYSKCGSVAEASCSFREVVVKDVFSWTSIIGVHARLGLMSDCLRLFSDMQVEGVCSDGIVVSCILSGFGNAMTVRDGRAFHGLIIRKDYASGRAVNNALLSMYCKFRLLIPAENIFERAQELDESFWNTMISGYSKLGMDQKCVELFGKMQILRMEADSNSLVSVISSCSQIGATRLGRSIHCFIIKNSIDQDISIFNSLVDMYGKGDSLLIAQHIFCRMQRDIVTWNTLISSYNHNGHFVDAIALFDKLLSENLKPNSATLVVTLSACSSLACLEKGVMIHHYMKKEGFEISVSLATALVDMYAKCGQLEKSSAVFDSMTVRDIIAWNVMISGYGMHGDAKSAIEIFNRMEKEGFKPNELTFLSVLSACAHVGLVDEAKHIFGKMQYCSVKPNQKHYACMVDLFGKSGDLQEAEELILSMPIDPDGVVWGSILSACKIHNDFERGIRMAKLAIESDPENDGYYITISNMYDSTGNWEEAERGRAIMKERGVGKKAGWSAA